MFVWHRFSFWNNSDTFTPSIIISKDRSRTFRSNIEHRILTTCATIDGNCFEFHFSDVFVLDILIEQKMNVSVSFSSYYVQNWFWSMDDDNRVWTMYHQNVHNHLIYEIIIISIQSVSVNMWLMFVYTFLHWHGVHSKLKRNLFQFFQIIMNF